MEARPDESVADLHRHLLRQAQPKLTRVNSEPNELLASPGGRADFLKAPGGFRRQFIIDKARAEGRQQHAQWSTPLLEQFRLLGDNTIFERITSIGEDGNQLPPLSGDSGTLQTVLALVKSFVGVAVTFMPLGFYEGGWVFSSVALLLIGASNAVCIWMIVDCRIKTGAPDFGEIATLAAGTPGRLAVQISLVVSQFGTCISYVIFVNKVVASVFPTPSLNIAAAQLVALVPLGMIRSIHGLEYPNLLADALLIFGIVVIVWYNARVLREDGLSPSMEMFRPRSCGLFIGTAVFAFEGIPLMLPVRNAMREPDRFMPLFLSVLTGAVLLNVFFGLLGYADYGSTVQETALNNLPVGDVLANSVKVAYCIALMAGMPLMFIPAARIVEFWIFGSTGKGARKWCKNAVRACEIVLFAVIAVVGGSAFDKFLAFVGAVCCTPIAYIYPSWFHLRLCAQSVFAKSMDIFFVLLGVAAMVFVLGQVLMGSA